MKYWIKGGIFGLVIGLLIIIFGYGSILPFQGNIFSLLNIFSSESETSGPTIFIVLPILLIILIISFILGSLICYIIDKIK